MDENGTNSRVGDLHEAALRATYPPGWVAEHEIPAVVAAFARVTPPKVEVDSNVGLVTIDSLGAMPRGSSVKPGNIVLNWRKLIDVVPDTTLAGLGAAALPIAPAWAAVLAGLYIWNKLWRGATEEFSEAEAITMLALWKGKDGRKRISDEDGMRKTNELRSGYGLPPLLQRQYEAVLDRLIAIECIELSDGEIWLREWVRIKC